MTACGFCQLTLVETGSRYLRINDGHTVDFCSPECAREYETWRRRELERAAGWKTEVETAIIGAGTYTLRKG